MKKLLHIGCGNKRYDGMDNLTQEELDIAKPWPYKTGSIDGIVSMQVLQQLYWRDLMVAFKEMYRVLKPGGIMRFGTMLVGNNTAEYALGWKNINLFTFELLKRVLIDEIGFSRISVCNYQETKIEEFKKADDRRNGKGTSYLELIK